MKTCSTCKTSKPPEEFHRNSRARDGLAARCKPCAIAAARAWSAANSERKKATAAAYRRDNLDEIRERQREYRQREAAAIRDRKLRAAFGISAEEYDRRLAAQDGRCAICRRLPSADRRLAVDHAHDTGEVRGLLCGPCNVALGQLGDSPDRIRAAMDYVMGGRRYIGA